MSTKRIGIAAIALSIVSAAAVFAQADPKMSFFVTSAGPGNGGNLGGVEGADKHCQMLAAAAGVPSDRWRAYLSTQGAAAVNARDRIGKSPIFFYNWYNAKGLLVARTRNALHAENKLFTKETALNEKGQPVNPHDILTGSLPDGTRYPLGSEDRTCQNWTSSSAGAAQVGHHDRSGGGEAGTSWNSAHPTKGCSQEALRSTGGDGLFYCFKNFDN